MEDNVSGEQSDLGPYCLQYKLHKNINSKLQTREAEDRWLNNGSFEEEKMKKLKKKNMKKLCELHNSNLNLYVFCKTNV